MTQSVGLLYLQAVETGALPFHGALVERDGKGFILAGSGGVGKTTCSRRLPFPWRSLCDDETLVVPLEGGGFRSHPFPTWSRLVSGQESPSWDVQHSVPLTAVFFLQQGTEDTMVRLGQGKAALYAYHVACQVSCKAWAQLEPGQETLLRQKLFHNAADLTLAVPAYVLRTSLNGRFWMEIDRLN
jgi:SynChlorMet cassette protein ScmC